MSDRDELAELLEPHYDISYDDSTGKVHCTEGDWEGYGQHSGHIADLVAGAGWTGPQELKQKLAEAWNDGYGEGHKDAQWGYRSRTNPYDLDDEKHVAWILKLNGVGWDFSPSRTDCESWAQVLKRLSPPPTIEIVPATEADVEKLRGRI